METKIDKGRKMVAIWTVTADLLKALSEATHRSQVDLAHQAVNALAVELKYLDAQEDTNHA